MNYTVKELANISNVSVRTLHFYDEIDLLKPRRTGNNGYRYYGDEEVLLLQEILFFRELGFELKEIKKFFQEPGFSKLESLKKHKNMLLIKQNHVKELILTIDKTIEKLMGVSNMKNDKQLFYGFSKEEQEAYETYLINRYGNDAGRHIKEAKSKHHTKEQQAVFFHEWSEILADLGGLLKKGLNPNSVEVQKVIQRHYEWLKNFWTPTRDSYIGATQGYTEFAYKNAFLEHDPDHPRLATFLANAAKIFAENNLKNKP